MTSAEPGKKRRARGLKARPLLVAVGAAALLAGCGDDTTTVTISDMGVTVVRYDFKETAPPDLSPRTD